jgi:hypothetical protein
MIMKRFFHNKSLILLVFILALVVGCEKAGVSGNDRSTPTIVNVVNGWAVLAEKDAYDDVGMTNMLVDHIDITRMREVLENSGWDPQHIHTLPEFDRETLQVELDWLQHNADGNDIVILFVSAHSSYLSNVLSWHNFFADEWKQIASQRRMLVIDACKAATFTGAVANDPSPHLSIAAVAENEYSWRGLEEEGLPIIGGVFTYYFTDALKNPRADTDGDGRISVQEAAWMAEEQQRSYFHDVIFGVPEFVEMYRTTATSPEKDPTFPHVIVDDSIGEPLDITLDKNH